MCNIMTVSETKRIGKFLLVEKVSNGKIFIRNNRFEILGEIEYCYMWKQYTYVSLNACFYTFECMDDVSTYLKELNKK